VNEDAAGGRAGDRRDRRSDVPAVRLQHLQVAVPGRGDVVRGIDPALEDLDLPLDRHILEERDVDDLDREIAGRILVELGLEA
jgi:hypothetical protein